VDELEAMQRAGLDLDACLRAATSSAAALLGLGDRGVLRAGARADLLVASGDLSLNLSALRALKVVIARGRVVEPEPDTARGRLRALRTGWSYLRGLANTVGDLLR
jgi:imidazolonepropionase-like amidohydrolase